VATDRRPRVAPAPFALASGRRLLLGERTLVMGIVNVTPDSFHAASRAPRPEEAVERALAQFDAGADIIDVGGESTRPGAASVSEAEEIDRVLPVIEGLRKTTDVVISIDTTKSTVAREAIRAGADIVNDVSGFTADEEMTSVLTETGAVGVLMHMRGTPADMASHARYEDVVLEVKAEIGARLAAVRQSGVSDSQIWIDPGLGFAKSARHNLELLQRLDEFSVFERPILVGASRKSFIGKVLGQPNPLDRLAGSLSVAAIATFQGAHVVRTHDVAETVASVRMVDAILAPELAGD